MTVVWLILGLALLVAGGELLVRGASGLASAVGISPLVIGLTVVAFGTSAPEVAVSLKATLSGQSDIAVGNVVGSNIFNVLFILGVSALICPLVVSQQLVRIDVPVLIGVSGLMWALSLDGKLGWIDGGVLFSGIVGYTSLAVWLGRRETSKAIREEYASEAHVCSGVAAAKRGGGYLLLMAVLVLAGLAVLVLGARWLVFGAVAIAQWMGVSELVIGLTIVAAGTSMPEVATSLMAAIRGQRDIAVGNVVGSGIFNILSILGVASIAGAMTPAGGLTVAPSMLAFDIPVMTAVAVACLPIFFSGHVINRWEGLLFLFYYAAYTLYLILRAGEHDALPMFSAVMMWFVVPLTAVTLGLVGYRSLRGVAGSGAGSGVAR